MMNILDIVNQLLSPPASSPPVEGSWSLETLYHGLRNDLFVREQGLTPTIQQFRWFFEWLRDGLVLAQHRFGPGSIPGSFCIPEASLVTAFVAQGKIKSPGIFVSDLEKDLLIIDFLEIALDCSVESPDDQPVFHKGINQWLSARWHVILATLEDCFHRYQFRILHRPLPPEIVGIGIIDGGMATEATSDHPYENEAREVIEKIVRELGVKLYPAPAKDG